MTATVAKDVCVRKMSLLDVHGANLIITYFALINSQATSLVKDGLKATFLRPAVSLTYLCSR